MQLMRREISYELFEGTFETHIGQKSNKCNQCDDASSTAGDLRRHLKTFRHKLVLSATIALLVKAA